MLNVPANCVPVCNAPACICASGFVRNTLGACVPPSSCRKYFYDHININETLQNNIIRLKHLNFKRSQLARQIKYSQDVEWTVANPLAPPQLLTLAPVFALRQLASALQDLWWMPEFVLHRHSVVSIHIQIRYHHMNVSTQFFAFPALPTCPANEVFSQCGNDGCRPTCANQNRVGCVPVCGAPACICAPGFVRNAANVCVPPAQCRKKFDSIFQARIWNLKLFKCQNKSISAMTCANPNEVFSTCGDNGCQRTCQRQDLTGCVPVCTVPACVCATGFVRNTAGQCVLPSACREFFFVDF